MYKTENRVEDIKLEHLPVDIEFSKIRESLHKTNSNW